MRKFEGMKKLLSLLLCAVLVMGMLPIPALAAEGDSCTSTPDCTGTYDADGICMICGAAAPAAGDGAGDSDNEETCQHSGGTATCTAQAVCELCGAPYGELADHAYGDDADGKCDVCGADCTHTYSDGICTVCGAAAPAAGDGAGDADSEETCQHSGGTATCKAQAVCELCNAPYGELAAHNYGTDADGKCDVCGTDCVHTYSDGACTACGMAEPVQENPDPVCICEAACGGDNGITPNCAVCLEDFWNCAHFVPTCSCAEKCSEEEPNLWCAICGTEGTAKCEGKDTSVPYDTYAVTVADGITNGSVTANPTTAAAGATVTLTATPAEGYELDTLNYSDGANTTTVTKDDEGKYTFTMPAKNVTVTATVKEHTHTSVYVTDDEKDTITLTCSGSANGLCDFTEETVTLTAPASLIADGKAKQFTYTSSISDVNPRIQYSQEPIPQTAGTYTVTMSITVDGETYSVSREYTILEGLYVTFWNTTSGTTKSADWTPNLAAFDTSTGIHFVTSGYNNKDSVVNGNYTVQWYDAKGSPLSKAPTDAGTYTIKVTLSDSLSGTCVLQGDTLTYIINPLDLSTANVGLYFEGGYPVYTGQKADLSNAYVGNSSYRLDKSEYTLQQYEEEGDTHIDAGQGRKVKIIGSGKNVTGEVMKTYNIGKVSLTLPDAVKKSYTYGQTPQTTDFTDVALPDDVGSIEVSSWHSSTGTKLKEVPTDVGEYKVYVKYVPADTVNYNPKYRFEEFEIVERKLTADVNLTTNKTYDSWPNAQVSCTPTNVVGTENILLTAMAAYDSADVGTGKTITVTFQLSGSDKKNYSAPDSYTVTNGEITPRTVTVYPERFSGWVWDGTDTVPLTKAGWTMAGQYTSDGLALDLSNATAKVETSDAGQNKPVIFENVVVNGNDKGNYKIEIEPRTITIQPLNLGSGSVTVTFTGDKPVYTGSAVYPENAVVTVEIMNQGTITLDSSLWEFTPDTGMNNTNAGKAHAYISATDESGNVIGKKYIQYTINPVSLADAVVTVYPNADLTYTGSEIEPEVIVELGDKELVKDTDYTVTYKQNGKEVTPINAGTYDVVITGKNNYSGTVTKTFTISPKSLVDEDIIAALSDNVIFEGQPIPTVTVKDGDTVLTKDTDYTVSQTGSNGEFTLTITGKGNYEGTYGSTLTYLVVTLPDPSTVEPYDEEAINAYNRYTELNEKYQDAELAEKLEELQKALTDYKITKGHKSRYVKTSYKTLSFTANGPVSKFSYIEVDGKQVDAKYYTVDSNKGTVITLKASYLEALRAGKHTIQVFYADGKTDTATFRISINNGNPFTGDDPNMLLFGGVAMTSLLCMAMMVMFYPRKKGKYER